MSKGEIFICDDDKGISDLLGVIVGSTGATVTIQNDSRLLYPQLERALPKLLIIDLWMPELPGDAIIRKLRSEKMFDDLYILCISASTNGEEIAMEAGADGFLAKPFDMEEILAVVNDVV